MTKCVVGFKFESDWKYATKVAQEMGVKPWDIIPIDKVIKIEKRLIIYFQNKKQGLEFIEFLLSKDNVRLNDVKIHNKRKWRKAYERQRT